MAQDKADLEKLLAQRDRALRELEGVVRALDERLQISNVVQIVLADAIRHTVRTALDDSTWAEKDESCVAPLVCPRGCRGVYWAKRCDIEARRAPLCSCSAPLLLLW